MIKSVSKNLWRYVNIYIIYFFIYKYIQNIRELTYWIKCYVECNTFHLSYTLCRYLHLLKKVCRMTLLSRLLPRHRSSLISSYFLGNLTSSDFLGKFLHFVMSNELTGALTRSFLPLYLPRLVSPSH